MEKVSNYGVVKEMGKKIGKEVKRVGYLCGLIYTIPTIIRKEQEKNEQEFAKGEFALFQVFSLVAGPFMSGCFFGGVSGLFSSVSQDTTIKYAGLGAIVGFATNLTSSIYESFRYTKKKMQGKLEKQEQIGKGLENTLNVNQ